MTRLAELIQTEADQGRVINVSMTTDGTGWNAELHYWPEPERGLVLTTQNARTPGLAVAALLDQFSNYRNEVERAKTILKAKSN